MNPEELATPGYELTGDLSHATIIEFVVEYFLRRHSWLTWLHHSMSVATFLLAVAIAWQQGRGFLRPLGEFGLAFVAMLAVLLPLHEVLHAIAYRLIGARDIRWGYSLRMTAVWVIAHRFVAGTRGFVFVALAPFVVINGLLIVLALSLPERAVFILFVLLWHLHGCAGDWGLLNFVWLTRDRGFWTYDDAVTGKSFFFGRAALRPSADLPLTAAGDALNGP
jgi:hypothetical protein